ncbi:hypothetical protein DP939_17275 [Spongiactinospora rosea]|uniref:Uncharacterized protein n=1 Tax=Spongiactinospora rosea TaxID=2248750 RepID=A0A366M0I3_9ACTN|nr:hypothetical protein [Spongiactinospora rosea]RBQ18942.1 hypothetical protein DP939_17275 [Spongiactinospora rosea]
MRGAGVAAVVLAVLPCAVACGGETGIEPYRCTLRQDVSTGTVEVEAGLAAVSASASSGFAELRRPGRKGRTFAAFLDYRLAAGARLGAEVRYAGADLRAGAGSQVGFYYESRDRAVIEEVLRSDVPPGGWAQMSVELDGSVAGSATLGLPKLVDVSAIAEARTAAELTLHADTGFTVTRSWSAGVTAKPTAAVTGLIGLERASGRVTVSYALRFDGTGTPRRLTVLTEAPAGHERVRQITRMLDLGKAADLRAVRRALPEIIVNPMALAPRGASYFLTRQAGTLVRRIDKYGTTVRSLYEVSEKEIEQGVSLVRFGGSIGRGTTHRVLRESVIRTPDGELTADCVGVPSVPEVRRGAPPALPPVCLPPAPPSPEVSTRPPDPLVGTEEPTTAPVGAAEPLRAPRPAAMAVPTLIETPLSPVTPGESAETGTIDDCGPPPATTDPTDEASPTDTPTDVPTDVPTEEPTDTGDPSPTGTTARLPSPTEIEQTEVEPTQVEQTEEPTSLAE